MLVRVLVLFLKGSVFFQWHTTFNKSKHASQTGWYVWKWQNPVSVSVGTTHSTVKIKRECQEFVMFTVVFPYMHPEGANIHASVMDEDDFDEFLTNKINNSVIVWTVMTFHLLLLKQDIIMLLFSHFKQVLPSSWTDLSHLVKQCPTATIKAFFSALCSNYVLTVQLRILQDNTSLWHNKQPCMRNQGYICNPPWLMRTRSRFLRGSPQQV